MNWIEPFLQDLRYAARQLRKSPAFALVAMASLALGVGANTAIFQLVNAIRLKSLPVQNPRQLAYVDFAKGSRRSGWFSTRSARLTSAQWDEIRTRQQAFSGTIAWSADRFNLSPGGEARYAEGMYVSADFYRVLGVQPLIGRTFTEEDDRAGCGSPNAVISYAFWQRELGGEPGALGRTISLTGHLFTVIGVTPASFFGVEVGHRADIVIPLCADRLFAEDGKGRAPSRNAWWLSMMGRLKPDWTLQRALVHIQTISPGIMQATLPPQYRPDMAKAYLANKLDVTQGGTGVSDLRHEYEKPLWLLLAITGLVLLIACANLANLLLARASMREREVAVRLAIGASRGRLIRQHLAESLLLAVLGAAVGVVLSQVLSRALVAFLSTSGGEVIVGLGVDWVVLGFTVALALATCILFGLAPAIRATRTAPATAMRTGMRGTTSGGGERFGLRRALVSIQVAISLVLFTGALLFVRSLHNLMTVDAGFQPEGILGVNLDLRRSAYGKDRLPQVFRDLQERIAAKPGIASVAQVGWTPVSHAGWDETVRPEGARATDAGKDSFFARTGPGYFSTMITPLLAGRDFDQRDNLSAPKVAIVNQAFARTFFEGNNPVGGTFRVQAPAGKPDPVYQIVGLVKNTKYYELREEFLPIAFLPTGQDEDPSAGATFVVRSAAPVGEVMTAVKAAVGDVSPVIGIQFQPFSEQIRESLLRDRLMATLSGAFGLLAGLLATLGLYGVIAYMVARRRNEIGVRMALGANRGNVILLVLREAGLLLVAGLGVGALLALWAGRAAASMLFGLQPHDPATLLAAMGLLAAVALGASYLPARRAAGLDPMSALRDE